MSEISENEGGYVRKQTMNYDSSFNLTSETNGTYSAAYTYDPAYSMMLTKTYKRDAATTIKIENTLSSDKRSITKTKTFENDILKNQTEFEYDNFGNVTAMHVWEKDANNNGVFDLSERTTIYSDFNYNDSGTMNVSNYIQNVKDADGAGNTEIRQTYNLNYYGYLESMQDPNGNITALEQDLIGRTTKQINPDSTERTMEYNETDMYSMLTDESGNKARQYYDFLGKPTEKHIFFSNEWILTEKNIYDSIGRIYETINYKSPTDFVKTIYTYYDDDKIKDVITKDKDDSIIGKVTKTYVFSATNVVITTITQGDSEITPATMKEYIDINGNKIKEEYIDGSQISTTSYTYDFLGNVLTVKDPLNRVTTSTYDYAGNVITVTNANNQTITNTYDKRGRLVESTDFKGNVTTNSYDKLDRLLMVTAPLNASESAKIKYYYDNVSNVVTEKVLSQTGVWNQKENTYNSRGFLTSVAVGTGSEQSYAEYEYTPSGQISALKIGDTNPQITSYLYNSLGQITSVTDPLSNTESYEYDWFSNVTKKTDKNGVETVTTYNGYQKPVTITAGTDSVSYTYDILGNIKTATNSSGVTSYTYDNFGRIVTETLPDNVINSYTYDKNNNRLTYEMKKGGTTQISANYVYNSINALTSVTNNGIITAYTYDNNGNLLTETTGQKVSGFTYDNGNRMISMQNKFGENVLESESYTYYLDGNKATKTELDGTVTSYIYDSVGRLKSENDDGAITQYFYDQYSNRMKKTEQNSETSYVYDQNNRLRKETAELGDETIINAYNYDRNGNVFSKMVTITTQNTAAIEDISLGILGSTAETESMFYTYNNFNQLTKIVKGSQTASYTYNPNGLRASKTVSGVKTSHIWDGQNMVGEYENGVVTAKYLRGLRLVARQNSGVTEYYNFNGHGDTTSLTNANGVITTNYKYDAFGNQANASTTDTNPFRYAGEYFDGETGMIYLRARYYEPSTGRFISEDPIKDGMNWYVYCGSNPVMYLDSSGLVAVGLREYAGTYSGATISGDGKGATVTWNNITLTVNSSKALD